MMDIGYSSKGPATRLSPEVQTVRSVLGDCHNNIAAIEQRISGIDGALFGFKPETDCQNVKATGDPSIENLAQSLCERIGKVNAALSALEGKL